MYPDRVLSGMRPTGALHLGHYHGVLKNWIKIQHEFECLFMVADWHALTTHYDSTLGLENHVWEMVVDWLAAGVDPNQATLFIQSRVPEHAELHLLLSMVTPVGWLERVPTYKEQQQKLTDRDLSSYGFLGYPLLQAADILLYRANRVPVGEDQVPHIEFAREVARRFNHFYGREKDFEANALEAARKMGNKRSRLYLELRTRYTERGDAEALLAARDLLAEAQNLSLGDRERLFGYLEGNAKPILAEPQALLTEASRLPGLDGQKMAKSYGNTLPLRLSEEALAHKISTMKTDEARKLRTDPGEPTRCPVYAFHKLYSDEKTLTWVEDGCRTAGIGCVQCKQPIIEQVILELRPLRERAQLYQEDPTLVRNIIADGCERARRLACDTLRDVREAMGLVYS
ncbi:tryptophan--tRNA ligase [Ferrovum myxofaciens]|jgi:tryptophanyl-tRNA synthetase|uniref:Tryptophan--tRNA ligase n=2 Tax=root TaxID=1 RepID=A0A8F3IJ49_9PROT|nr:tryptophan--tRNA ligase [Ferrovum myxofaciens]MBW8028253.1 tryptophan--tRNA ligase [Ferrovum sp.]KXW58597.1 tryptophan--tRNA ligase [Ferrovum myxofaciens]MBU6994646.1 tryptophan--tRNA ligase [Ferrovum myxofaciens]NDU90516.1 tryptophan--tRNA ligase [Ferrovum sp.]QKE38500.1 MAG: tryptophan--tRNA ligase [Ferrovum myxofaciens]